MMVHYRSNHPQLWSQFHHMAAHTENTCMVRQKTRQAKQMWGQVGSQNGAAARRLGWDWEGLWVKAWLQTIDWKILVAGEVQKRSKGFHLETNNRKRDVWPKGVSPLSLLGHKAVMICRAHAGVQGPDDPVHRTAIQELTPVVSSC